MLSKNFPRNLKTAAASTTATLAVGPAAAVDVALVSGILKVGWSGLRRC